MENHSVIKGQSRIFALILACTASLLTGCSTTLTASKFDHEKSKEKAVLGGVPFTINKPTPTVTRTPGSDGKDDTYVIKLDYVPDPNGRYVLQIAPSMLSSVDFSMSFDANGSLTETTAKTTDQTATVITSAAKFGLAAGLDKSGKTEDALLTMWKADMDLLLANPNTRIVQPLDASRAVNQADRDAWQTLYHRLKRLATEQKIAKTFAYVDRHELALLLTLEQAYRSSTAADIDPFQNGIYLSKEQAAKKYTQSGTTVEAVRVNLAERNRVELAKLRADLTGKKASLQTAYEQDPNPQNKSDIDLNFVLLSFVEAAQKAYVPKEALLLDIIQMSPGEWQRRRVTDLNRAIDERRHVIQVAAAGGDPNANEYSDSSLKAFNRQKAIVLGVSREYERSLKVNELLLATAQPKDMKALRDELSLLNSTISNGELALKSKAADMAKADDGVLSQYLVFNPTDSIDSLKIIEQLNRLGGKRPKYVVAVQAITATQVPSPTPALSAPIPANNPVDGGQTPGTPAAPPLEGGPFPAAPGAEASSTPL